MRHEDQRNAGCVKETFNYKEMIFFSLSVNILKFQTTEQSQADPEQLEMKKSRAAVHMFVFADRCNRLQSVGGKEAIKVLFTFKSHRFDLFLQVGIPLWLTKRLLPKVHGEHKWTWTCAAVTRKPPNHGEEAIRSCLMAAAGNRAEVTAALKHANLPRFNLPLFSSLTSAASPDQRGLEDQPRCI